MCFALQLVQKTNEQPALQQKNFILVAMIVYPRASRKKRSRRKGVSEVLREQQARYVKDLWEKVKRKDQTGKKDEKVKRQ